MQGIIDFARLIFDPDPLPIAKEMKRHADRVVRQSDRFGDLVKGMRGMPGRASPIPKRPASRSRKK